MRKRFYLNDTSYAGPTPDGYAFAWDDTGAAVTREMGLVADTASTSVSRAETSASDTWDVLLGRWISPPMTQAGVLPVQVLTITAAYSSTSEAQNLRALWTFKVIDSDGVTKNPGGALVFTSGGAPTGGLAYQMDSTIADDIDCEPGDRLVIELGYRAVNTSTTSVTGTLHYGGEGARLVVGDTGATATSAPPHVTIEAGQLFDPLPTVEILRSAGAAAPVLLAVEVAWGADVSGTDEESWAWTDVTSDVLVAEGAKITMVHGRADEAGETQPANCTLLLRNSDGRYSLGPDSPNYPYVRRNTPVRVRVQPGADPVAHDQFVGFADGWTPRWDSSGNLATVELSASGTLRRLLQRQAPVMSGLHRAALAAVNQLGSTLVAYWPLEDGPGSSLLANLVPGGRPAAVAGKPELGANTAFLGSAPIVNMNQGVIRGSVPTAGNTTGAATVRWLMATGGNPSEEVVVMRVSAVGTLPRWDVSWDTDGGMYVRAWNSSGAKVVEQAAAFNTGETVRRWQLTLETSGGTTTWALLALEVGFADGGFMSGSVSGTVQAVSAVAVGPDGGLEAGIGHVGVWKSWQELFDSSDELNGYRGERADERVERLCAENNIPVRIIGSSTVRMGAQSHTDLVSLLRECETADQGLLLDGTHPGLTYICGSERVNAEPALTLSAAGGELVGRIEPVDNDQRNVNRATASRTSGAGVTWEDTDGPFGTAAIGEYEDSLRVNVSNDSDVLDYAGWAVHLGTLPGYRYPSHQLALHHNPELVSQWVQTQLSARVDLQAIASVRPQFPAGDVASLLEGSYQELDAYTWDVTMALSSYSPWRVGEVGDAGHNGDPVMRLASDGSTVASSASAGATSLSVATPDGPLWSTDADDYPLSVDVDGREVIVTAVSGASSPQTFTVEALPAAVAAGTAVKLWRPPVLGVGGDGTLIVGSLIGARSLRRHFPQVDYAPELSASQADAWADVGGLFVQVESYSRYALEGYIGYSSSTAADVSFAVMAPYGTSGSWSMMPIWISGGSGGAGDVFAARTLGINGPADAEAYRQNAAGGGSTSVMCSLQGYLETGPADGVIQIRFAQIATTASATTVDKGSWLRVTRLGDT